MIKILSVLQLRHYHKVICGFTWNFHILQHGFSFSNYSFNNWPVIDSAIQKYVNFLEHEYNSLKKSVINSGENGNIERLQELEPIMEVINARKCIFNNLSSLNELSKDDQKDKELLALVDSEQKEYENKLEVLNSELLEALLPEDSDDLCEDVVIEVTAGVGGQEAMLFARELFDMYCGYAEFKCWKADIAQLEHSEIGGIRHAVALLSGDKVFQHLKHEAGVHRVQRIPVTEKSGRVHTSTVTVAAFPQPEEIDIELKERDLKIETKRSSGAGGQHVNTTDSAVRITHIPTGIVVDCQEDRSQFKNREIALQRLRARLFQQQMNQQLTDVKTTRKQQVGSSLRSEKIRTYNFNQDRITDHRLGGNLHNLRDFLSGSHLLDTLIQNLHHHAKEKRLIEIISQYESKVKNIYKNI